MAKLVMEAAVTNHMGRIRKNNEDNFYLNGQWMPKDRMDDGAALTLTCQDSRQLYAVCDGMGGADCGEEASFKAASSLGIFARRGIRQGDETEIAGFLHNLSGQIYQDAASAGIRSGTTLAMLALEENHLTAVNMGDSRIYRFRNQRLDQISLDHSKVQQMIDEGRLTPDQARIDPNRHIIYQFLGMPPQAPFSPQIRTDLLVTDGDLYLICSDGLTDMLEDAKIAAILTKGGNNLLSIAKNLQREALDAGGRDNITVLLLRVCELPSSKELRQETVSPGKRPGSAAKTLLTIAQVLVGAGLAVTLLDGIYYLLH